MKITEALRIREKEIGKGKVFSLLKDIFLKKGARLKKIRTSARWVIKLALEIKKTPIAEIVSVLLLYYEGNFSRSNIP